MKRYLILSLCSLFFACRNDKPIKKQPVDAVNQERNKQTKPRLDTVNEQSNEIAQDKQETINAEFNSFFKAFKKAINLKDKEKILPYVSFPLRGLYHCYLINENPNIDADTLGINQKTFVSIYSKIFDQESLAIKNENPDSLRLYEDDIREYHLKPKVDAHSPILEYMVVYVNGRHMGDKSFFFGKIKGKYKLFHIACEGHFDSRGKY